MACEETCFTFTWELENISYCIQKEGGIIKSPAFVINAIDETKWKLRLYPRGSENANYIGYYLSREADSRGADRVAIHCELSFIAKDGSVLESTKKFKFDFPKDYGYGGPLFIKRKDVFISKRSAFLPQDTLTTRCRIWKSVGKLEENVQCFARTRIGIQKRSYLWNVKHFSTLKPEKKCNYLIKSIENDAPLMSVDLSLVRRLSSEEIIRFKLSLQDQTIKFSALRLSLIDAAGNRVECNQEEFWHDDPSKTNEFKFSFTNEKLMAMKSSYLPDDILSMYWEWTFSEGVLSEKIEDVQYAFTNSENTVCRVKNMDSKKMVSSFSYTLHDNLKSLYGENFLCDIKLKTKTRVFNVHKIILSASSPVFKAMFSSDMKEKESNCVNIEDLSDDTVNRMLLYIYAARMEGLTWEMASHLYVAADKYAILSLKNICSSYLKDNLSPSNACEVLLLSDLHADGDFKSGVQDYILKHIKEIVNSDEWKLLMEANAKLAAETMCLQYK